MELRQFFFALCPALDEEELRLRFFNLCYYVKGFTAPAVDRMLRPEWMAYYKLLQKRKEDEAKPAKKE